jgi:hypothetical protein
MFELEASVGRTVSILIITCSSREAAILVLGIISGFNSEFKSIDPQLKNLVPYLIEELSSTNN